MRHIDLKERFSIYTVNDGPLLEGAQILRGKVFFDRNAPDRDRFDEYCDHLVAFDHMHERVVGTYRLLRGSVAKANIGFYSETEFDLSNIKKHCTGEVLEMGRACVSSSYRRFPVINLIWKSIIEYVHKFSVNFIFGCASIAYSSHTHQTALFLKNNCYAPEVYRVHPYQGIPPASAGIDVPAKEIEKNLPSLVKGYLKMGAHVCGEPAWDKQFNTADFFMLLDVKKMDEVFKEKFI